MLALSKRYPSEGGIYLWTRREFSDAHGFLAGWSSWLSSTWKGTIHRAPLVSGVGWEMTTSFSVMCNAFIGIELASAMGVLLPTARGICLKFSLSLAKLI